MGTIYLYTINKQILTLGNYINMDIYGEITGDFATYVTTIDPMYMQEYGHTIDSRAWVPAFLFGVGLPSLISSGSQHQVDGEPQVVYMQRFRVYEMRANRKAAKYFGDYYGVDWNTIYGEGTYDTYYPQHPRNYLRRLSGSRLIRR